MVDGVHSTDLGMQQYADSYLKKIREILHEKNEGPTSCIPCKQQRDSYDWYARHEEILKLNRENAPEIIMIGNSITHYWAGELLHRHNVEKKLGTSYSKTGQFAISVSAGIKQKTYCGASTMANWTVSKQI